MYILGVSTTLLSDAQKNFTLSLIKERPILIKDGFYKYTRSPNHLGEMFIYLSFACVVNHWLAYSVIVWAYCSIFVVRIFEKEMSYRRKKGWELYASHSWILFPKINGRTTDSLVFYGLIALAAYIYLNF